MTKIVSHKQADEGKANWTIETAKAYKNNFMLLIFDKCEYIINISLSDWDKELILETGSENSHVMTKSWSRLCWMKSNNHTINK